MPTYTQYEGTNGYYSSASNSVLNNNIPLFKDYVQFRTAQNSYVLIIGETDDNVTYTDATVYVVDGSSGNQELNVYEYDTVTASYSNSYYTYNSFNNPYYNQYQRNQALADSLIGFSLTGGIAICVVLALLRRLFLRRS